jgi:hypothetical protein
MDASLDRPLSLSLLAVLERREDESSTVSAAVGALVAGWWVDLSEEKIFDKLILLRTR